MKRALSIVGLTGLILVVFQSGAFSASSGTVSDEAWVHEQEWGDWCAFDPDTAVGHTGSQSYSATTETVWSVEEDGDVVQEVTQTGSMTTDGVTRPFTSSLRTTGPADAYLDQAPLTDGEDYLAPRFFDDSLYVEYSWTVEGFYTFEYHNASNDGLPATYGPTFCS